MVNTADKSSENQKSSIHGTEVTKELECIN